MMLLRHLLAGFLAICILGKVSGYITHPGIRYPPTKGEVWPKPKSQNLTQYKMVILPDKFEIESTNYNCEELEEAIQRYKNYIIYPFGYSSPPKRKAFKKKHRLPRNVEITTSDDNADSDFLNKLTVVLSSPCEKWPGLDMKEKYILNVDQNGEAKLTSDSIWGILRGLETFSQLVYYEDKKLQIKATEIVDEPRFKHRGVLLDTSRHFMGLSQISDILDGLAFNKFNVFHWHIVDDESFPYKGDVFPRLADEGKFYSGMLYTIKDVKNVIEYARRRGIRVVPEFDTPGHTRSWGVAYPWLLTQCYTNNKPDGRLGPMNPSNEEIYPFIKELFKEVVDVFPDTYFHLGGDELEFDCWSTNPDIAEYMERKNISSYYKLEEEYIQKVVDIVQNLSATPMVYQEVYQNNVQLPKNTVVQIWTGSMRDLLYNITKEGMPVLLSTCWYLDHLSTGGDWEKYYNCDPHDFDGDDQQKELVFGGEACMWGEVVDDLNVVQRIFPRASATAEKLWSPFEASTVDEAKFRLEEHYCRMQRRGIRAQPPNGPGFCPLYDEN